MPEINATPRTLKPYTFMGVHLDWEEGGDQAIGECPFCGKEKKFSVNVPTGVWRCFVCNEGNEGPKGLAGGNALVFLRLLYERAEAEEEALRELAEERKLLSWDSLEAWGVRVSPLTREIIIPGYNAEGKLNNVYVYRKFFDSKKKKWGKRVESPPTMNHQIFGMEMYDPRKHLLHIAEGIWDGIALWEVAQMARYEGDELVMTGSSEASLYAHTNIIAVPGCTSPTDQVAKLVGEKGVTLLFDNDHPQGPGKVRAAYDGMMRFSKAFASVGEKPNELHYLNWGKDGFNPELPHGTDVRDILTANAEDPTERVTNLNKLLGWVNPIPDGWVAGRSKASRSRGELDLELKPCTKWSDLQLACRKSMKWTGGLDCALSVMLASIVSTKAQGDQLWVKIIGPASCGKSTLCDAISVNRKYVFPKDSLAGGLISGFQSDKDGDENQSMVERLRDKTLVINDGDTLLQLPNLSKVLSQLRAFYGRNIRSQYGNKMSKDHEGINCTVILCGTASLRKLDSSELGERFLDCVIMEGIDPDMEDEVNWRVVNAAERALNFESEDTGVESQNDPNRVAMFQLCGGYIDYLRGNAKELFSSVDTPDSVKLHIARLGTFTAYIRARPSREQDEGAEREFAARLTSQLMRLAKCLAVVLNKTTIDEEVMRRVQKVALNTARGVTMEIARHLFAAGTNGMEARNVAMYIAHTEDKTRTFLQFLRKIKAVEVFTITESGVKGRPKWRLTERVAKLYREVVGGEG